MRLVQEGVEVVILNLNKPQNLLKLTRGERVPCTRITK